MLLLKIEKNILKSVKNKYIISKMDESPIYLRDILFGQDNTKKLIKKPSDKTTIAASNNNIGILLVVIVTIVGILLFILFGYSLFVILKNWKNNKIY